MDRPRLDDPAEFALIKKMYFAPDIPEQTEENEYFERKQSYNKTNQSKR